MNTTEEELAAIEAAFRVQDEREIFREARIEQIAQLSAEVEASGLADGWADYLEDKRRRAGVLVDQQGARACEG